MHVALFVLANLRQYANRTALTPPASVMVELVAPPSSAAPGRSPAVEPARPKPKPERVVNLPKPKPQPPKPKAVELPKPAPKPAAKPMPKPEVPKSEAPAEPTKSAAEVLAALRDRVSTRPDTETPAAAAASAAAGGRFDPEMAAYHNRVKALLRSNWANGAFANDPSLKAQYLVRVDSGGGILSIDLVHSSGNPFFDESAERAIKKSAPWPAPPRGAFELDLVFNPGGVA